MDLSTTYVPPPDYTATQHDGTGHLAVNDTPIRRLLTRLALKTTARLYRRDGPCFPISRHLIVKKSRFTHLTEAATLNFIATNTSVPVPRVHCAFVHKNTAYIVMQRIQGVSIAAAWPSLSESQRTSVCKQLRTMLGEVRALLPPNGGVQSCIEGSLRDSRIPRSRPRFAPFKSILEFHSWLRDGMTPESHSIDAFENPEDWHAIQAMIARQDGQWPAPVFTHGDLNPFNIFVSGDQVSGIIDWEFAGWYPDYWEYTAAWYGNDIRKFWQDLLPEFLDVYAEDLEMEITRQKWWGDL